MASRLPSHLHTIDNVVRFYQARDRLQNEVCTPEEFNARMKVLLISSNMAETPYAKWPDGAGGFLWKGWFDSIAAMDGKTLSVNVPDPGIWRCPLNQLQTRAAGCGNTIR